MVDRRRRRPRPSAERADRGAPRAPRPAAAGPPGPRRARPVRDAALRPFGHVRRRLGVGRRSADRDGPSPDRGRPGHRPRDRRGSGRRPRRRAGHAFLDPRGRGASSRGESGQPDAVDHVRAPPGSRRSLPALRRAPRERSGGQAEPRAIRHALGRYRAARRGQHRRRRPLRGHPPRGASVVRRDGPAAPAAGRRLRRRPRAAAGRTGSARERGALPSDGGQRAGDGVALGTRWPTDVREPAVARLHRPPPGRRAPRELGGRRTSGRSAGSDQDAVGRARGGPVLHRRVSPPAPRWGVPLDPGSRAPPAGR